MAESQLGLVDELTYDPAISREYHDVGMQESSNPDFVSTWPSKCVSPTAQLLCMDRAAGGLGTMDDAPARRFAFDQYWNITAAFKGVYSQGSIKRGSAVSES